MADATERLFVDSGTGTINKNYKNFILENAAIPDLWDDGDNVGGAAIFVNNGTLTTSGGIDNTQKYTFSNNSNLVTDSDFGGGAILLLESKITASNLVFEGNSSVNNGGAISIKSGNNQASTLKGVTFDGNTATDKGGAIYMDGKGTLTLENCTFKTASDTIYLGDAQATITFKGDTELDASVTGKNNTKTEIEGANITFNNTAAINILKLNVVGAGNSMTFAGSNTVNFTSQDLSAVSFGAYTHSEDSVKDVVATGVSKISDASKAYTLLADNKNVEFFFLDGTDLTHYRTDTLTVVYGKDATGAGEFASVDDLYDKVDGFAGTLGKEVAANYVYDGSLRGADKDTDGVKLTIAGEVTGSVYSVLADGEPADGEPLYVASASVAVTGTVDKYVIGGAFVKNGGLAFIAKTDVVLAGKLNNNVFGGSWVSGDADDTSSLVAESNVVINAGADQTAGYVLGGGMASGKDVFSAVESSNITVNADVDVVLGGGWAQKEGNASVLEVTIDLKAGTVGTVFAGGTNQAGSFSEVNGNVVISLDGGTAEVIHLNGKYSGSIVAGDVTLEVKQNATVEIIEGLTSTFTAASADTNTTINVAAALTVDEIAHVDNWNIAEGGAIDFTGDLNFEQKIGRKAFGQINLNINDTTVDTEGRDVLTTAEGIFNFNADFVKVTLNDEEANYDADAKAFISDSYTLSIVDDNKLVFAAAQMQVGRW